MSDNLFKATLVAGTAAFASAPMSGSEFSSGAVMSAAPSLSAGTHRAAGSTKMDAYSKVEIDAKLTALSAEARADRVAGEGKLDRALDAISRLSDDVKAFRGEITSESRTTRWSIWGLAAAMMAIVVGTLAFAATANGNIVSAFAAGHSSAVNSNK